MNNVSPVSPIRPANQYDAYAGWTDTVAKYPPTAEPFYLALGIADEVGELDATSLPADVLAEAGDCFWYCARYSTRVLGIPFSEAMNESFSIDGGSQEHPISVYVGTICGVEKKRIRDGELWDAQKLADKNSAAYNALLNVLAFITSQLNDYGIGPLEAIEYNMTKLGARLESGTIRGDGDQR